MKTKVSPYLLFIVIATLLVTPRANGSGTKDPFVGITPPSKDLLQQRLAAYVDAYKARNWGALYGLVSDTGRGDAKREYFIARMEAEHGKTYADDPDLLNFSPDRSLANESGYDLYGCGTARREGKGFHGIAVVHTIFEHGNWFFTGWRFTSFPNENCKHLSKIDWTADSVQGWDKPMIELRPLPGVPFHIN